MFFTRLAGDARLSRVRALWAGSLRKSLCLRQASRLGGSAYAAYPETCGPSRDIIIRFVANPMRVRLTQKYASGSLGAKERCQPVSSRIAGASEAGCR